MNTEDNRFWLGTGLGVLGVIPPIVECLKRDFQHAAVYSLVLLLMFAWFFFSLRSGRGPQYDTLCMKKTLEIVEADGSFARMRREQRIKVNYGQLSEIWCRNIVADGSIQNLLIDGRKPNGEKKMGCLLSIHKHFDFTLFKGQKADIVWTHELIDAFTKKNETLEHDVTPGTHYLELLVNFPEGRPCLSATLHESVSGEPAHALPEPEINQRRTELKAVVKRPKEGHTICLNWDW